MNGKASADLLIKLRKERPLVHHITNYVTVNDCANITMCIGGTPVMADAMEEVAEMVSLAGSLVLNIGTLRSEQVDAMLVAGKEANRLDIPIVLDPVGVGATKYRTETAQLLLKELRISVLKGNAGEIGVLAGTGGTVKGVDSIGIVGRPVDVCREYAKRLGAVVVMSGTTDIVTDGDLTVLVDNGHEMMGSISGTGCMASSIVGSFAAVSKDHVPSSVAGLASFGIAGERAARSSKGPYSFKNALFDAVSALRPEDVRADTRTRIV
jgi:hydroxyethylthiazole kinase